MKNGIYVSALKYAANFDHQALVSGIARAYAKCGIAVKSEPTLPGGKHADLAVSVGDSWTYIEVKTRSDGMFKRRRLSYRQALLREILRLRAHSLKQLPRKETSLVVLATSVSPNKRNAISKITIARSFAGKIFDHDARKVMGLMIFTPFQSARESYSKWRYASTLIPNPNLNVEIDAFEKLGSVQL